jgi:hypothetical protein
MRKTIILVSIFLSASSSFSQLPFYLNLQSTTGKNCVGNKLHLNGANYVQSITWYCNGDSVGVAVNENSTLGVIAGGNGSGQGLTQLSYPKGICLDRQGNLYVCEWFNNRITKWLPGATSGVIVAGGNFINGSNANQLNSPTDVFVDFAGNIFIADQGNHRIQKWAPGATTGITVAGGNGAGAAANKLNSPVSIFVDKQGNIYVSDQNNNRVQKWSLGATTGVTVAGGNGAGSAANQLNKPEGIFVDNLGNLFVSDYNNNRIQKWSPGSLTGVTVAGNGVLSAGSTTAGTMPFQLYNPKSVFVDAENYLHIADYTNSRIQRWKNGYWTGITEAGGNGKGTALNQLSTPNSVIVDSLGNIYVSDVNNHRVIKWKNYINLDFVPQKPGAYFAVIKTLDAGNMFSNTINVLPTVANLNLSFNSPEANCFRLDPIYKAVTDTVNFRPTYQWYKNNSSLPGEVKSVFTTNSLQTGDSLKCKIIYNSGGCVTDTVFTPSREYNQQPVYKFIGNGNWTDVQNWQNKSIPPDDIPCCSKIIISPSGNGECVMNLPVLIPKCVDMIVDAGKKLKVNGDLKINYDSSLLLNNNVILPEKYAVELISTGNEILQGIYKYSFTGVVPQFKVGDVILGSYGNGYIRKVTAISISGNIITLQTNQSDMESAFKQGNFGFNLETDSLLQRGIGDNTFSATESGYTFTIDNRTIYQNNGITISLNNGSVSLNPNWNFNFDFKNSTLKSFAGGFKNASLIGKFDIKIDAERSVSLINKTDTLKRYSKTFTKWIPVYGIPVPVVVVMNLDFICKYAASTNSSIRKTFTVSSENTIDMELNYKDATFTPSFTFNTNNKVTPSQTTGVAGAKVNLSVIPAFSFELYGIAGPYGSLGVNNQTKINVASPSLDWDLSSGVWLSAASGIRGEAFGKSLFDYGKEWSSDTLYYKTPYDIEKVSGDNQIGLEEQKLKDSIVVIVKDALGLKQSNVPVYFKINNGNGKLSDSVILSDQNGIAAVAWSLGAGKNQSVVVNSKLSDGRNLISSGIIFNATTGTSIVTLPANNISDTQAFCGAVMDQKVLAGIRRKGICYGLNQYPTINDFVSYASNDGTTYECLLTQLLCNTKYYARAFIKNDTGVIYGNTVNFSTLLCQNFDPDGDSFYGEVMPNFRIETYKKLNENDQTIATSYQYLASPIKVQLNFKQIGDSIYTPNVWQNFFCIKTTRETLDSSGNITSSYTQGYIPNSWAVGYYNKDSIYCTGDLNGVCEPSEVNKILQGNSYSMLYNFHRTGPYSFGGNIKILYNEFVDKIINPVLPYNPYRTYVPKELIIPINLKYRKAILPTGCY